jgi:hypothetical protein
MDGRDGMGEEMVRGLHEWMNIFFEYIAYSAKRFSAPIGNARDM